MSGFSIKHLSPDQQASYLVVTKCVDVTDGIHLGAIALAKSTIDGYAVTHESLRIETEGISKLKDLGKVRCSIFNGAIRYTIKH